MTKRLWSKGELMDRVGMAIRALHNTNDHFDEAVSERLKINRTDLRCLDIIDRERRITAGALAAQAGLTTGAVTMVVDRLAKRGYARRVRDEADRRQVHVELTPTGTRQISKLFGPIMRSTAEVLNGFTEEQLAVAADLIERSSEALAAEAERLRAG